MKKITQSQVDEAYKNPINPLKPFERMDLMLGHAVQQLTEPNVCPDCEGEMEQISTCCGGPIDEDTLICLECKEHSDIEVCETCNGSGTIN